MRCDMIMLLVSMALMGCRIREMSDKDRKVPEKLDSSDSHQDSSDSDLDSGDSHSDPVDDSADPPCEDEDGDGAGVGDIDECENTREDCNDTDPNIYPGAPEICDGIDNDCNRAIDEGWYLDLDGDGYGVENVSDPKDCLSVATGGWDCDDMEPTTFPHADEPCDLVDNDCDGNVDEDWSVDFDGDGCPGRAPSLEACASATRLAGTDPDESRASWACVDGVATYATLTGVEIHDLAAPGDITGDGVADLLLGATDSAYVVPGPFSGGSVIDETAWRLTCEGCALDVLVSRAGDLNGDGYEDLLIGGSSSMAWVVPGPVTSDVDLSVDALTLTGTSVSDHFGKGVAPVGDNDGDGLGEFAVFAPDYQDVESDFDGVYSTHDGRYTQTYFFELEDSEPGATVFSASAGTSVTYHSVTDALYLESAGSQLIGGGDFNGDGYGDNLITANFHSAWTDNVHIVWLIEGPVSVGVVELSSLSDIYVHEGSMDSIQTVSQFADFNGDGYDDFVTGQPEDHGYTAAVVVYGDSSGRDLATIPSYVYKDDFGFACVVGALPDADGDGADEVIVGPDAHVYLDPDYGYAEERWRFPGGGVLLGGGDMNGDGLGELIDYDGSTLRLISLLGL